MALGPGQNEIRKLQATGGSTFTVSLPKPWVLAQGLSARDSMRMDWRPSGALRVTPLDLGESAIQQSFFATKNLPENSLHDHLMGAYISGSDEIHIEFQPEEEKSIKAQVRHFLRSTRGFEIMDEEGETIMLKCLMNAGDMPLHASLNRMYLQVTSLSRDILGVFEGAGHQYIADAEERENEVDALLYLVERQTRILLNSHLVATKLNLTRTEAVEYANLARSLERMMDHAYSIATMIIENPKITKNMIDRGPIKQISNWQAGVKELMINIRTRDSTRIEKARYELKKAQLLLMEHEQYLLEHHRTNEWMAFDLRLSESVRRLCAYARDFGEILLNMKVFSELHRTRP